ncbi:MAG: zinc ribbon domain-containing protein [Clostridia bacterium]|jgi:putative FmdB family regulatory protein
MPTYEYVCKNCQKTFEKFQYIKEKELIKCPFCKKNKLERKIGSGSALIFKGKGFYCTDYQDKH